MFAKRIILLLAAVGFAGLILSGFGTVHAQTASETSPRGLVGEVRHLSDGSFTLIQNGTGEEFILFFDGSGAGVALTNHGGGRAQFQDGAQVAVLVNNEFTAVQILVKPSRPSVQPFSGAVTAVEKGMLTVVRPNGETLTIQIPSGERPPQTGAVVMGFARASDSRGGPPVSIGLTTAQEMRSRLEGFLEKANNAASHRSEPVGSIPQARSARLAEILANHTAHQVTILEKVLGKDNLSNKARTAVMRAHSSAKAGLQRARDVAVLARTALGDMGVRGEPEAIPGRGSAQTSVAP